MQKLLGVFTVLGLFFISTIKTDLAHYTVYKSFPSALNECAEYYEVSDYTLQRIIRESFPNTEQVRRLVHCTLVNLGAWDSSQVTVRNYVLKSHFRPALSDSCYQNRTEGCLKDINGEDHFCRAYESFQCYYRQYGNIVNSAQYVPFELNELYRLVETGFKIQNVPRSALEEYSRGNVLEEPHFKSLHLTGALFGGYYSLRDGINLTNAYRQFGSPELLTAKTRQCCDAAQREECDSDHATKLYRVFKNCLQDIVSTLKLVQVVAKKVLREC